MLVHSQWSVIVSLRHLDNACSKVFSTCFLSSPHSILSPDSDSFFCRFPLFQCLCRAEASLFAPRPHFSNSFRIGRVSDATDSAPFLSWDCIMLLLLGLYSPPSSSLTTRNNLSSLLQAYPPDTCSQEPPSRLNVINLQRACAALAKLRCLRNGHCALISCHWHVSKTGNHAQCASKRRVPRPRSLTDDGKLDCKAREPINTRQHQPKPDGKMNHHATPPRGTTSHCER